MHHPQRSEALARREAGEPIVLIAKTYNLSHSTISRWPKVASGWAFPAAYSRDGRLAQRSLRRTSIDFNVCFLDDLAPLRGFVSNELRELLRSTCDGA